MGLARVAYAIYLVKVTVQVTFTSRPNFQMSRRKVDKTAIVIGQLFFINRAHGQHPNKQAITTPALNISDVSDWPPK